MPSGSARWAVGLLSARPDLCLLTAEELSALDGYGLVSSSNAVAPSGLAKPQPLARVHFGLNIPDVSAMQVFLLNANREVLWRGAGDFTAAQGDTLRALLSA